MTDNKKPSINLNGAEIKRLAEDALKSLEPFEVRDIVARMQETINRQQAEIERLNKLVIEKHREINRLDDYMQYTRAEAFTKFANKLCEGRASNDPVVIAVKVELEETVGDAE